ncbi:SDR family NAD(P)-dependent oxidoreductase [Rhodococcus sp. T2V]|uniref:SDR family NAD(P)-dependent oxidoreductase n=1 Tax=Rhodococcus sp. T2V TaxID=3034164 RepID=UPI0023E1DC86|nr:SDR family oxidoreductase [Rhodococcus sp. T2V]MDF3303408.1 SDR family NAD(P)-dependent oxidoreductase [Rhodococcus sp. T2V]
METVIVTGAAGGIGSLVARHLSATHHVIGLDVSPSPEVTHRVDLSCLAEVRQFVETGGFLDTRAITGIVHCAGVQSKGSVGELGTDAWISLLNVNVRCIDVLVNEIVRRKSPTDLSVVVLGSVHSTATSRNALGYSVSKSALAGWVRAAALELGPAGVRVNCVSPGAIATGMLEEGLSRRDGDTGPNLLKQIAFRTPMRRLGLPSDLFSAVSLLLDTEASGFMTGSEIVIDGGVSICLASEV